MTLQETRKKTPFHLQFFFFLMFYDGLESDWTGAS